MNTVVVVRDSGLPNLGFDTVNEALHRATPPDESPQNESPRLQTITVLDASHNDLCDLAELPAYTSLHTALLSHNLIASLKLRLPFMCLRHLNVSHNHLTSLAGLTAMPELRILEASSNALLAVHEVSDCTRLETLALGDNGISNLFGLECLLRLRELLLENNAVDSMMQLRPLSVLPVLTTLAIAGNPVAFRCRTAQHLRAVVRNFLPGGWPLS